MILNEVLGELLDAMGSVDSSLPGKLEEGLLRDRIVESLSRLDYEPPESLIELYEWRNGNSMLDVEILPGGYFSPLDLGLLDYSCSDLYKDVEPLWNSFRILSDHSDGGYAVAPKEDAGRIIKRCVHDSWEYGAVSIAELFHVSVRCYREGVFKQVGGSIEADWELFEEIAGDAGSY